MNQKKRNFLSHSCSPSTKLENTAKTKIMSNKGTIWKIQLSNLVTKREAKYVRKNSNNGMKFDVKIN